MGEIFRISNTQKLEYRGDEVKLNDRSNDVIRSTNQLISDYVMLAIDSFTNACADERHPQDFIFTYDDYFLFDNFEVAKKKIELFSYNSDNENELNFIIDLLKYIKHTESELVLSMKAKNLNYFTSTYEFGDLRIKFRLYPESWLKVFELKYKGNVLIEYYDYIEYGVKVIEQVHPVFSDWDVRMNGNDYTNAIEWFYLLESYVMKNM